MLQGDIQTVSDLAWFILFKILDSLNDENASLFIENYSLENTKLLFLYFF